MYKSIPVCPPLQKVDKNGIGIDGSNSFGFTQKRLVTSAPARKTSGTCVGRGRCPTLGYTVWASTTGKDVCVQRLSGASKGEAE